MYGIRILSIYRYPPEHLTEAERAVPPCRRLLERDGSEFALYFASILPALERLVWFADEQAFYFPLEWFFDEEAGKDTPFTLIDQRRTWIALKGDGRTTLTIDPNWILQPGFVTDYAQYVNDDWNWLYGFTAAPNDWRNWMRRRSQGGAKERAAFLESTVEVCFFNVDGAFWEFFSQQARLVEQVRDSLSGIAGLRLEPAELQAALE